MRHKATSVWHILAFPTTTTRSVEVELRAAQVSLSLSFRDREQWADSARAAYNYFAARTAARPICFSHTETVSVWTKSQVGSREIVVQRSNERVSRVLWDIVGEKWACRASNCRMVLTSSITSEYPRKRRIGKFCEILFTIQSKALTAVTRERNGVIIFPYNWIIKWPFYEWYCLYRRMDSMCFGLQYPRFLISTRITNNFSNFCPPCHWSNRIECADQGSRIAISFCLFYVYLKNWIIVRNISDLILLSEI